MSPGSLWRSESIRGLGIIRSHFGCRGWWIVGAGLGWGRGVPRPWFGLAGGGGGLLGPDSGAFGDGDLDEGLEGVMLRVGLCGGSSCWR